MVSRQRRTRKNRQHPYSGNENSAISPQTSWAMKNPENWMSAKFREELQKLGINIPKTWSKSVLKQLYADNKERCVSSPQVIGEDVQAPRRTIFCKISKPRLPPQIMKIVPSLPVRACVQIYNPAMEMMSTARAAHEYTTRPRYQHAHESSTNRKWKRRKQYGEHARCSPCKYICTMFFGNATVCQHIYQ